MIWMELKERLQTEAHIRDEDEVEMLHCEYGRLEYKIRPRGNARFLMSEAYERGLARLNLGSRPRYVSDLRTNPAFAWRVLEALLSRFDAPDICFGRYAEGRFCTLGESEKLGGTGIEADVEGTTLADALYAAVEAVGREG